MSDDEASLARLQRWMQTVIVHPGGVEAGVESPQAQQEMLVSPGQLENVIARSHTLSSQQRLEIYSKAYTARLVECLRAQFPILVKALGEELFDRFAAGYLQAYPSQSYSLGQLGQHFVDYLRQTRPDEPGSAWPDFLIDLARLEWEFDLVFDGPGAEGQSLLAAEQIQAVPADTWPEVRLALVPCLRLLKLDYPVHEYYRALRRQEATAPPSRCPTWLAVTRRDYVVRYYSLTSDQHTILEALLEGASLGEAIAAVAAQRNELESLAEELHAWFRFWCAEGWLWKIETLGREL